MIGGGGSSLPAEQQPFRVPLKPYTGTDPARLRAREVEITLGEQISDYINQKRDPAKACFFSYTEIAADLNADAGAVERLLQPMGGRENGITV